jgi:hypothetical protein
MYTWNTSTTTPPIRQLEPEMENKKLIRPPSKDTQTGINLWFLKKNIENII